MRPSGIRHHLAGVALALAVAAVGCGEPKYAERNDIPSGAKMVAASTPPARAEMAAMAKAEASRSTPAEAAQGPAQPSATAGRKIIYTGAVDLVTEDLGSLEARLTRLVAAEKAYVADSERTGSAGSMRRGSWRVRVPVEAYDPFVKAVVALGELVSIKADSQDVSEEYYDLDARQEAKKVEEQRLLKHLTESTGKLEDILAVERELSRVRTEIERMQGRLRALANLTSLATVTITASEVKDYVPPRAPTLGTKLARSFEGSVASLRESAEGVLIGLVAVVPWLPLVAIGVGLIALVVRRLVARLARARPIAVPPSPGGAA